MDALTVVWVVVAVFVLSGVVATVGMTPGLKPVHAPRAEADRRWSDLLATLDERRHEITVLAEESDVRERVAPSGPFRSRAGGDIVVPVGATA